MNRFPLSLGEEEPDIRFLIDVDDNAQLPEFVVPEPEDYPELSPEEYVAAVEATQQSAKDMKVKVGVSGGRLELVLVMC